MSKTYKIEGVFRADTLADAAKIEAALIELQEAIQQIIVEPFGVREYTPRVNGQKRPREAAKP